MRVGGSVVVIGDSYFTFDLKQQLLQQLTTIMQTIIVI